jgi:hypothetical protein
LVYLVEIMHSLHTIQKIALKLNIDGKFNTTWHLEAAFAAHNNKKSHTGATMLLVCGAVISVSTKQRVNT